MATVMRTCLATSFPGWWQASFRELIVRVYVFNNFPARRKVSAIRGLIEVGFFGGSGRATCVVRCLLNLCGGLLAWAAAASQEQPMKNLALQVQHFLVSEDGPTAVEYAVMLALIIIVCLTAIQAIGTNANATFNSVAAKLPTGAP
jgi:pilus assembly protein Flp/PilA